MKTLKYIIILIGYLSLSASSCKKDKTGIDALPAATQEGKNTFGCLVNGEVFIPQVRGLGLGQVPLSCYYSYENTNSRKGYYLSISATDSKNSPLRGVDIDTDSLKIEQSKIYKLEKAGAKGIASAEYVASLDRYYTSSVASGKLKITKLDESKKIISGTFCFDAVNETGEKVEVREGRFDLKYR
ncbi:hypothetical protein PBAC_00090 [Pedobacter glucosidilyticus]|nr:DUF6252 family protein [Pedobacter glucosidilyticus]KHJ39502.1 hypothetical protein PBAC_00090 [Pedobacter glucosidilyticus]